MRRGPAKTAVAVALVWLTVLAGCASPVPPRSLVPAQPAQRPLPAGAELDAEPPEDTGGEDCGDPTASLRPNGLTTPGGSTMAKIRSRGRLVAGVDQNSYLFGFRDPATGELEGFDIDIARELAARLLGDPSKVQFKALTVRQRIDALKDGSVDVVVYNMTITCERRQEVEFSSVYFEAGQRVLVHKDSGLSGVKDLGGLPVCAPAGSTSLTNLAKAEPPPELVAVVDLADCLLLLQQGQVQAVSTDDTVLAGMAKQDPTTEVIGGTFSSEPYGIGIPKANKDMVRYVNAALEEIRAEAWPDIYRKWLEPVLGPATPPRPTYK